jgi:hypothetical protein
MRKLLIFCLGIVGLASQSGCVVYAHPRPVVYEYPAYDYCPGPTVVVVHGGYYGGGYYHRHW